MKRKHIIFLICASVVLSALVGWIIWGNLAIEVTDFSVQNSEIPEAFDGFRIAQISDLHNAEFGKENADLVAHLERVEPDIIVLTGDIIDSRRTDISVAIDLAPKLVAIAPTYYVTGNHEGRLDGEEYKELTDGFRTAGVIVLENEAVTVTRGTDSIVIVGVEDPRRDEGWTEDDEKTVRFERMEKKLTDLSDKYKNSYSVLLSHRPDMLEVYAESGVDLVFSGHMHGGQFRVPFLGGLYAPSHGFFPEYDAGLYELGSTDMIVSRGLGNSLFPFRINNRPEIVVVELNAK
ncbi:MAG: metallophosphoesterase [Ruminococcaceae bacterium]|nr:metallophosphoesterase [Oscillospiraceae bacterium]